MTEFKFVFVAEIHLAKTTKGTDYYYFIDHEHVRWSVFPDKIREKVELKKGYIVEFEKSGDYNNIVSIKPAVNKLQEKEAEKLVNLNDLKKDVSVATSYAIQLAIFGKIEKEELFDWSDKIHDYITKKAEGLMPKETK